MMSAMLEKAVFEGTGKSMANIYGVRSALAGKTGTSQDYGDAWFLAYNNDLVIASRVGATYPIIHFNKGSDGAGSTLALPLVAKTLQRSQRNANTKSKYLRDLEVPDEYLESIACVDHIDDSDFEKFFDDLFKDRNTTFEKASKKAKRQAKKEKRKSWFKRVFGKKEKS